MSFSRLSGARRRRRLGGPRFWILLAVLTVPLAAGGTARAIHSFSDLAGHTALERIVTGPNPDNGYANLTSQAVSGSRLVRDGAFESNPAIPNAQPGRAEQRRSLTYFGQMTDFQLADEETPAKVEFLDGAADGSTPGANSAWRPQEALQPFIIDQSIRQMNQFAGASPVTQGDGSRAAMDFALMTGDQADSAQRNETIWVRELLEGGQPLNFNSGSDNPMAYDPTQHPSCANFPPSAAHRAEALRYTGVQDYDDYDESQTPNYYDPDVPTGFWSGRGWPTYTGLMDRAQQLTITPAGSSVPTYVTNGNHDPLVQGNEDPVEEFENIATGCIKALTTSATPGPGVIDPDPSFLLAPGVTTLVPPDPKRRYVSKPQIRSILGANGKDNAHGYGFVPIEELRASCRPVPPQTQCDDARARLEGSASYYAWDPPEAPGFRFISIDTMSEGGQTAEGAPPPGCGSANGNIDDPQFQWLRGELQAASDADKLIVIFGHHPVRSLCAAITDEQAAPCTTGHVPPKPDESADVPQHDRNPGCDIDPRSSAPIHLGRDLQPGDTTHESFVDLLANYPHVIAYVAGHTHEHRVLECGNNTGTQQCPAGSGIWWEINTSATADWPVQHRLIEVMDNRNGTLSIFGTLLDHAAAAASPSPGSAAGFTNEQLASIGREFAYNDPQAGNDTGECRNSANQSECTKDQNVELLVPDPRRADLSISKAGSPGTLSVGERLTYTVGVTNDGPSTAEEVALTDKLPKHVRFRSVRSSQGRCSLRRTTISCALGDIADGGNATVTIEVRPSRRGLITNTATASAAVPPDPNTANNTATTTTTVN
jgi:uncharacterized repeat protein (TIGR01451 family)